MYFETEWIMAASRLEMISFTYLPSHYMFLDVC